MSGTRSAMSSTCLRMPRAEAGMGGELDEWRARLAAMAVPDDGADGAHDATHVARVWRAAASLLAEHPEADPLIVLAACHLHDIVNLPKQHPDRARASRMAAERARRLLADAGFPADKLDGVAHAIEAHSFSAGIAPRTIEACIVQDADPLARDRPLDDRAYALDHIEAKLATLPATMRTAAGARLAEKRLDWLRAFRDTFVDEWGRGD